MMMMLSSKKRPVPWLLHLFAVLELSGSVLFFGGVVVQAAPLEDLVADLPGYGRPPTPHFSGYLDATAGCNTKVNGEYCKLHYWLALAEPSDQNDNHDDATAAADNHDNDQVDDVIRNSLADIHKPVVLWLNGGPGSSSILGFLTENGPLLINATGGLMENPWSWTKVAHLLVLEAVSLDIAVTFILFVSLPDEA
jgi:Serine carboxypeptidase